MKLTHTQHAIACWAAWLAYCAGYVAIGLGWGAPYARVYSLACAALVGAYTMTYALILWDRYRRMKRRHRR